MAFLIRRQIFRDWDGGSSYEYAAKDPAAYWENRKGAWVFEDEAEAEKRIEENKRRFPDASDEFSVFSLIPLSSEKAENQRKCSTRPQFVEGGRSRWKK